MVRKQPNNILIKYHIYHKQMHGRRRGLGRGRQQLDNQISRIVDAKITKAAQNCKPMHRKPLIHRDGTLVSNQHHKNSYNRH